MTGCDHKFVDSTRCLKCGWTPDGAVHTCDRHGRLTAAEYANEQCVYCVLEAARRADKQRKRDADRGYQPPSDDSHK